MPRTLTGLIGTVLATFALVAGGLAVATPAEAGWSRPGDLTRYRLCRAPTDDGDAWRFVSRVRKYAGTPDARAGIKIYSGRDRVGRWSSGWLKKGEVQVSTVRVQKSPKVRVWVWEEAGDRESSIGTTTTAQVLKPKKIRRC